MHVSTVPGVAHSRVTVLNSIFGGSGHICSIEHSTIFSTPPPPPSPPGAGGECLQPHPSSPRYVSSDQSRTLVALLHIHFFSWEPPSQLSTSVLLTQCTCMTVTFYSYPPIDDHHFCNPPCPYSTVYDLCIPFSLLLVDDCQLVTITFVLPSCLLCDNIDYTIPPFTQSVTVVVSDYPPLPPLSKNANCCTIRAN
jgi:hypothetical protein